MPTIFDLLLIEQYADECRLNKCCSSDIWCSRGGGGGGGFDRPITTMNSSSPI